MDGAQGKVFEVSQRIAIGQSRRAVGFVPLVVGISLLTSTVFLAAISGDRWEQTDRPLNSEMAEASAYGNESARPVKDGARGGGGCVEGQICFDDLDCGTGTCDPVLRVCICKCAPPGDDCFSTACDGTTSYDFSLNPIPANFLHVGSPIFSGVVVLGGTSGFVDTTVKRLAEVCFTGGFPETVGPIPVEVTQLDLKNCSCIDVGGVLYDVIVSVAPPPHAPGDMTITKNDALGGTFTSNLTIDTLVGFVPCGSPPGTPVIGPLPLTVSLSTAAPAPWLQDDPGTYCGANGFFAGWRIDPTVGPCCDPVCHQGPSADHPHCVYPPECQPCPGGPSDEPCPPPDPTNDPCAQLAATQCLLDPVQDEQCRPTAVEFDPLVGIVAVTCDCISPGDKCGPIDISPDGDTIICPGGCPSPNPPGICEIHFDGLPMGVGSMPGTAVPPGVIVTCACPGGGPPPDPHKTLDPTTVNFDSLDIPAIPANFFEPGSDPFGGSVGLQGGGGGGGSADTLIQRMSSVPPLAVGGNAVIDIELVALNLRSIGPITVPVSGSDTLWDVDLSLSGPQPQGQMTVYKTHNGGGMYSAGVLVQPRFTFTKVSGGGVPLGSVVTLDYPAEGLGPVEINLVDVPWVENLAPHLQGAIDSPSDGNFAPGVDELVPGDPNSQVVVSATGISKGGGVDHTVDPPPILCPLRDDPAIDPCAQFQTRDCDGSPNQLCLMSRVQVQPVPPGGIAPIECACFTPDPDACGPIEISPDGDSVFCPGGCVAPQIPPCQIWVEDAAGGGTPTGMTSAPISMFPPDTILFCDCDPGCQSDADCDDGDPCTTDVCLADGTCKNTPDCATDADCDDGDPCTTDTCRADGCCDNIPECTSNADCDDANACTTDTCDPVTQCCVYTPDCATDADCDDGDACTTDTCRADGCCDNTPDCTTDAQCDDGNACTTDTCITLFGCCLNSLECSTDIHCDDGDDCTIDTCDADGCCQHAPDPACYVCEPLSDGSACTDVVCPATGGCFGTCDDEGRYCDNPACPIGELPACYIKNSKESIKMCGDCFGECIGGSYCDNTWDLGCCIGGTCVCYAPWTDISIQLCGDCFGECINGSYCDHPNPDCCIGGTGACMCYLPTHPISIKMCSGPDVPDECEPKCVNYDASTGTTRVLACECVGPDDCHVDLGSGGARGVPVGGDACVVVDNGTGTVNLPPEGCEYMSPEEVHQAMDDLGSGTTIVLAAIHKEFICRQACGDPGGTGPPCTESGGVFGADGEIECFDSKLELHVDIAGEGGSLRAFPRTITIPNASFVVHTGPRNPGAAVQDFPTEMVSLSASLGSDPDFDSLVISAGSDFGLPSPGHTTLTQLPSGDFAVDSFFDITYQIDFVGDPDGALAGMSGSTVGTIKMATGSRPTCVGGCPAGETCHETQTVNADGTMDICCTCEPEVTGACCLGDPPICIVTTQADCLAQGGTYAGDGTNCDDNDGNGIPDECQPVACGQSAYPACLGDCPPDTHCEAISQTGVVLPSPQLPPDGDPGKCEQIVSLYEGVDVHALFPGGIDFSDPKHKCFQNVQRMDDGQGNEIETFDSTVEGLVDIGGGPVPVTLTGPVQVVVFGKTGNATGTFATEIVSMSLTGNASGMVIDIRESPSLAASGQTTITDLGGGLYEIDSFFDVFTELSVDGGPFQPQTNGAGRMVLVSVNQGACECVPNVCGPTTDGSACQPFTCPIAGETCKPQCAIFDPLTGAVNVTVCECSGDECHVDVGAAGGVRGVRDADSDPCVVLDNGTGTVTLPPIGCDYMSPEDVHEAIGDLPVGTTIELAAIHKEFWCKQSGADPIFPLCPPAGVCEEVGGELGGNVDCFTSTLELHITGNGPPLGAWSRTILVPNAMVRVDTGLRTPGDAVQDFSTEIVALSADLQAQDDDFCQLSIKAGRLLGLPPSTGHTTLTALGPPGPGTSWEVDSFFDVEYEIVYQGCAGGALAGYSGSTTGTIHMETGGMPECVGGCPDGEVCVDTKVVNADGKIEICCTCESEVTGACCLTDGTCVVVTQLECDAMGGTYAGDGTNCDDNDGSGIADVCECGTNSTGTGCKPVTCPDNGTPVPDRCQASCVSLNPLTGAITVTDCECRGLDDCHVDLGPGVGGNIPPNSTLFVTVGQTSLFPFSKRPVPADFFYPGSPPLTEDVNVQSVPLGQHDGFSVGATDTVIAQLEEAVLDGPGSSDTVAMELAALSLGSISPVTVGSTQWDVHMGLSPTVPTLGSMTITQTSEYGGVWEGTLDIYVAATFTEVGNPANVLVLDTGGSPPLVSSTTGPMPWSYITPPEYASVSGLSGNFFTEGHEHTKKGHKKMEATLAIGRRGVGRAASDPCVVLDNGSGTVNLPPDGCEYLTGEEVHAIIDGLPGTTTFELAAIHKDFWCKQDHHGPGCPPAPPFGSCEDDGGDLGGKVDCFGSTLELHVSSTGPDLPAFSRILYVPVMSQVHTAERTEGDAVQEFDTEMYSLEGELWPDSDADFCTFEIRGGRRYGLPSPGHTTLRRLGGAGSDFAVDSFFDVEFTIHFVGCPGSVLANMSGTTQGTVHMATGSVPECVGDCPPDEICVRTETVDVDTGQIDICCGCEPPPCEGACCYQNARSWVCRQMTEDECDAVSGAFLGCDSECPKGPKADHWGVEITHYNNPPKGCDGSGGRGVSCTAGGDPVDPWSTDPTEDTCHQFALNPIPADFFGPGSDPFSGEVCLEGEPLEPVDIPGVGLVDFGEADTLVQRSGDPFDRCASPSLTNEVTVATEVIALSLVSIDPMTVTFGGMAPPEQWDVVVDLSPTVTPEPGSITATKTHCNGGTYRSELHVQPRFTFTKVGDPGSPLVLDTGLQGQDYVTLYQPNPNDPQDTEPLWANDLAPQDIWGSPLCTDFHPAMDGTALTVECACPSIVPPELPTIPQHRHRKHRYLSINPTTNPQTPTVIKVEVAEMKRCQNDLRRSCLVDLDCPDVCQGAPNTLCTSDAVCGGDAPCINSGPCVDATPSRATIAWLVQAPEQVPAGCIPSCTDEDWIARLSDNPYADANNWQDHDLLHIADCGISPGITYAVYACDPANVSICSQPLYIGTQATPSGTPRHFGDIAGAVLTPGGPYEKPDGFVNVIDVSAWGLTKQNYGTPTPPQLHPTMADLHGGGGTGVPANYILGLSDQQAIINHAFTWALPWDNPSMLGGVDPSACPDQLGP